MSRLAKKPLELPKGVEIKREKDTVFVKGPKGALTKEIPSSVEMKIEDGVVHFPIDEATKDTAFIGLYRAIVNNQVIGVSQGFEKKLILIGVGYRANVKGTALDMQLGFSHPCELPIPEGIEVKIEKSTIITISGCDKQLVGQFAADVRALRPPEPYKGKGVRYENEYVRKKAGKTAKGK